jgi:flagellar hook protein FlgE
MGIYSLLSASTSGMAAQSALLNTVGDNIANASTIGYKRATTEFSSLVLSSGSVSDYQAGSVLIDPLIQIDGQGALNATTNVTDLAIQGNGFFVVLGPNNQPVLTRVGDFQKDSSGNLVNAAGFTLLGYPVNGSGGAANGFAGLVPVNLNSIAMQATPTTSGQLYVNLPSNSPTVAAANLPSLNTVNSKYTQKTSLVAYDSLGNQVTLDVYLSNKGGSAWEVDVFDASAATNGTFPYTAKVGAPAPLVTGTLTFNASGQLVPPPSSFSINVPGGSTMTLDMSQTTQLAANYTVLTAKTNGNAPSQVADVAIANDGTLSAVYQNGSVVPAYRIPLANVASPNKMTAISGNAFQPGLDSGAAQIGVAGTAGLGAIKSSSLEASTVDLASELTTMIAAQNNYQANSKVFTTGSTLLQTLINLGH